MELEFRAEELESTDLGLFEEPAFEEMINACWSLGPLQVCARSIGADRIEVDIKLAGIRIGSGTLTVGNNQICVSGNVQIFKVKLCVRADFAGKTVWVEGQLCTRKITGGWSCRKFKTKILSW